MKIRRFKSRDAAFCFKTRSNAFIRKFYSEIGPRAVAACVNAYLPDDYLRMAEVSEFFVVEEEDRPVGFFTLKRIGEHRAELPLIYLDLDFLGSGIGTRCLQFMEGWIAAHWKEVDTFIVDTVVPEYNGGFYEKAGFERAGQVVCAYPDMNLDALRLQKKLGKGRR
jgi:GNAT superfamily N-acetyltransferase